MLAGSVLLFAFQEYVSLKNVSFLEAFQNLPYSEESNEQRFL